MMLQNKSAYPKICLNLLAYMEEKWPAHLTYHTLSHIVDVANVCNAYIEQYAINDKEAKLIRIAAIGHDIGYLKFHKNHEELGIQILKPFLDDELNLEEIETVNNLIRATKVPQKPTGLHQEILADADLDYLGRKDYDTLSELLYKEFLYYGIVANRTEWLTLQISFLENHCYHTTYALQNREKGKLKKIRELKEQKLGPDR